MSETGVAKAAQKRRSRVLVGAAVGALLGLVFVELYFVGIDTLRRAELVLVDTRFRTFPEPQRVSPDIVVVKVDEESLHYLAYEAVNRASWPFDRRAW
ncbi:MAG: CHASE2 domain-containing protein [Stellaceae bacterium]